MARRRKQEGGSGVGILFAIVAIINLLLPVFLLGFFLWSFFKYRRELDRLTNDEGEIWISDEDKEILKDLWARVDKLEKKIRRIERQAEKHELLRKADGTLDRRNPMGRTLQDQLDSLEPERDDFQEQLDRIADYPFWAWGRLLALLNRAIGALFSLAAYFIVAFILSLFWNVPLSKLVLLFGFETSRSPFPTSDMIVPTVILLALTFLTYKGSSIIVEKSFTELYGPRTFVNIDNVDTGENFLDDGEEDEDEDI